MRVFLFDIDGTLLSTGGAGSAALFAALTEEFGVAAPQSVEFSGCTDRGIARSLFEKHEIEDCAEHWERLRASFLKVLPTHLAACEGRVLPGVAQILEHLAGQETAVGLLTGNTREGARLKLAHYQIERHFLFGGFGDDHFERDDVAREALAASAAHVGAAVDPRNIWVVGDTPRDIRCARAIGANVVAVATGIHQREELLAMKPDVLFEDLSDVDSFLQSVG